MFRTPLRSGPARCALAVFALLGAQSVASAAFTISLNGVIIATDGGEGDSDGRAGIISFSGLVDGYSHEIAPW